MRPRRSDSARLTHVATVTDSPPADRRPLNRLLAVAAMTGVMLAVFFGGRHWVATHLASHWRQSLRTVPDDRVDMLVASAARLGRPGFPVLVAALGSPRENIAKAGRRWLDRHLDSWENLPNREAQRNVEALAEALAAELDSLDPAARRDAAHLAGRMLRWRLDSEIVDRARVTWLCDRVLQAADYVASKSSSSDGNVSPVVQPRVSESTQAAEYPPAADRVGVPEPRPLEIPKLPQEDRVRGRIASQVGRPMTSPVVPLPSVASRSPKSDLADAWTMRGHRLGQDSSDVSEVVIYPRTGERVLVPAAPEIASNSAKVASPIREMSLSECFRRLHGSGLEPLGAEAELKRRGFDALRLSIARRVHDPDRHVRLKLIRDLPGIPGIGAADWLMVIAADQDEEVRLAAITLLATVGDPGILAKVESMARNDPVERIRQQAERLAQRRQTLNR